MGGQLSGWLFRRYLSIKNMYIPQASLFRFAGTFKIKYQLIKSILYRAIVTKLKNYPGFLTVP